MSRRNQKRKSIRSRSSQRWRSGLWSSFVLLLFVLGRFAWKPLLEALHSREQHLEHVLLETERARNESEANLAEHRKLMARAGDEVRAILEKARKEAQATAEQLIKQAQGEAEQAKQRAQRDIASGSRPGPGRDLGKDRRHGRLGRRQGALQRADRHRASPLARRRDQ